MFLHEAFPPELIKLGLEAEEKEEVFKEMVDLFCRFKNETDRAGILEVIKKREEKMSTGISRGIAIPHGKTSVLKNVHGIMGISRKGIEYDSLDGSPVYLVFMLLAPLDDSEEYLRLLKRLSELVDNERFFSDLAGQKDPEGVNAVLRKYDDISSDME